MDHDLDFHVLSPHFSSREAAVEYLERFRWPDGPVCPHCGESERKAYRLKTKSTTRRVWKCAACRKQFTVTVGTIFEDSHIPLNKWLLAFYLLCSSKKGMSARQLHRMLGITYKSAWFMCHRIRWAMGEPAFTERLSGTVEVDETYIGGKARNRKKRYQGVQKKTGRGTDKAPVIVLVERGGNARSAHVANVSGDTVKGVIRKHVAADARRMTDSFRSYAGLDKEFASHQTVNHIDEWVIGEVHTNTAENFFAILKRGLNGVYHHVSETHLHRYLSEFDFRYNARAANGYDDAARTRLALSKVEGKRLMYRDSAP
jgi:transposase-like protein